MSFQNPTDTQIRELLEQAQHIAVIGLSGRADRPSHGVGRSLQRLGYTVIPINPQIDEVLGERAFPDLAAARAAGLPVDIVDVFRSPQHVPPIVEACIELELPAIWLQEGVIATAAAERAREHGITTIMNLCIYKEHVRLIRA